MKPPLLLYSTNTWLAFSIAERYYGGIHYAWCSPEYDGTNTALHVNIPPTSSPAEIYWNLWQETRRGERHSQVMKVNRRGILRGARAKMAEGAITAEQLKAIQKTVARSQPYEFRPLLFVIPFAGVESLVDEVPASQSAHPLSVEFRIPRLPRDRFHVLELRR